MCQETAAIPLAFRAAEDIENLFVRLLRSLRVLSVCALLTSFSSRAVDPERPQAPSHASETTLAHLMSGVRARAKTLENSSGMRLSFQSFTSSYKIAPSSISYSDFVVVRLLYEATRDAGFWNMHWTITNMPPNSDRVWSQWKDGMIVSPLTPTASAECDELSALLRFWWSGWCPERRAILALSQSHRSGMGAASGEAPRFAWLCPLHRSFSM